MFARIREGVLRVAGTAPAFVDVQRKHPGVARAGRKGKAGYLSDDKRAVVYGVERYGTTDIWILRRSIGAQPALWAYSYIPLLLCKHMRGFLQF
jgi:hypothetical protein